MGIGAVADADSRGGSPVRPIRAADMPGADDLMLRIYAAMAQKERELSAGQSDSYNTE